MLRPYEVMIIFEATLEEDSIQAIVDRATQLITERGGNTGQIDRWGKRRFAYELNKKWEGYYVVAEFTGDPTMISELDRVLRLADEVIRHKVIRLPEKVAGRPRRSGSAGAGPVAEEGEAAAGEESPAEAAAGAES
jgi:small subunit ribosomal protein S6